MRYISTRGQSPPVSFLDAILAGLAPDGGLYMPETWPSERAGLRDDGFAASSAETLRLFANPDIDGAVGEALCRDAYAPEKWPDDVTPLVPWGFHERILELGHGPSLSFKDVAMQLIGPLYDFALTQRNQRLTVVCATSGDTGGAAVEALKGSERVDLFVLTPKGRVSDVQRRFMTASGAANIFILEIDGDFDACQAIVKVMFADRAFADASRLSGVNSINWARIVAQSVYFSRAAHIVRDEYPDKLVNFVVPTGNFGDAFSGYAAKMMGAPIGRIILATNSNDILVRALETGTYARAEKSYATISPAMDIQVASNFERILFEALQRDGDSVASLYDQFARKGSFDIPKPALAFLRNHFLAASIDDAQTLSAIEDIFAESGEEEYLACPHTAVGFGAFDKVLDEVGLDFTPIVSLATAHPAKFPETVEAATGVRPPLPARCSDLFQRTEKFDSLPADAEAVKTYIRERSRAWSLN